MSDNDLASKLARGMRRAKQPSSTDSDTLPVEPVAASSSLARERALAQDMDHRAAHAAERFADQTDQAPRASLDRPWENLHPKRIWPD